MNTYKELLKCEDVELVISEIMEAIKENDSEYGKTDWNIEMALEAFYSDQIVEKDIINPFFNSKKAKISIEKDIARNFFFQELERNLVNYNY